MRQALDELGIDEVQVQRLRAAHRQDRLPVADQPAGAEKFAKGLDLIIVVEEKRSLIEVQVREELYGTANQPVCIGKKDEQGNWLFPVKGALDSNEVAICIGERLLKYVTDENLKGRVARLKEAQRGSPQTEDVAVRIPYFCSGCPHNSSTVVPEGSRAYAGIGCHYMAQWMDRSTLGFTQMGGEGANWIGEAPFSKRPHVFQNIGDGTYNHSGYMAIRAAIASGVNITYKILYNDAVAMTGGQMNDGGLTVPKIARAGSGRRRQARRVVRRRAEKYPPASSGREGITIHHRDELAGRAARAGGDRGLSPRSSTTRPALPRNAAAVSAAPSPIPTSASSSTSWFARAAATAACKSNCVSVQPLETEFGRKRAIDQSSCNKDFSCLKGFCPCFVTLAVAQVGKRAGSRADPQAAARSEPTAASRPTYNIVITDVGGTGIVTVGAILGMAAHLEGKGAGEIEMAGLAQKGGAVHIPCGSPSGPGHLCHSRRGRRGRRGDRRRPRGGRQQEGVVGGGARRPR